MDKLIKYFIVTISIVLLVSGKVFNNIPVNTVDKSIRYKRPPDRDTAVSKKISVSYNEEDFVINDYLLDRLTPIRTNFNRINSIENWTKIFTIALLETLEGGAAMYFSNENLEKIITMEYGETYQVVSEYYFLENELSFAIEKTCKYNRPLFYDSTAMIANNDTEVFDLEKSEINVDRSYFEKGKLIHKISDGDCGAPFSKDYLLEEEIRIKSKIGLLLKLEK